MSGGSGATISQEVINKFQHMKVGGKDEAYMVAMMTADKSQIVLDESIQAPHMDKNSSDEAENKANFEKLVSEMKDAEPRYIVFDFRYVDNKGAKAQKLGYILWCSDKAPVSKKMIYASNSGSVKKSLSGINIEFQINEMGDFTYSAMLEELRK